MFLGGGRETRGRGRTPAPKILAIRRCAMLVSRPDSEIDEASNGKAPLLTKPGLSKTVGCERSSQRQKDRAGETVSPAPLGLVLSRDHHSLDPVSPPRTLARRCWLMMPSPTVENILDQCIWICQIAFLMFFAEAEVPMYSNVSVYIE